MFRLAVILLVTGLATAACSSSRRASRQILKQFEVSPAFSQSFTGFLLMDAQSGRTLNAVNADHYFTPASNVKILTLAACLRVLGDSLPRYRYQWIGSDTSAPEGLWLYTGTADPTTLHPDFAAWQHEPGFFELHPGTREIYGGFMPGSLGLEPYGPGWMWDDFGYGYSAERSHFPVFGNHFSVFWNGTSWKTEPAFFQRYLNLRFRYDCLVQRDPLGPAVFVPEYPSCAPGHRVEIPVFRATETMPDIGKDTLFLCPPLHYSAHDPEWVLPFRWYGCPSDTAYRRMMYQSDNFFAEQLLLVCSGEKFDTLNHLRMIGWMRDSVWAGIPNPPRWADGSGLSRYNLATPRFLGAVLRSLWLEQPPERLFDLFPAGGVDGTVNINFHGPDGQPYVFAKSGSMSGVYCLSGYVVAKSGRVLIFSCMNNNFTGSNTPWKKALEGLLVKIYETY